MAWKQTFCCTKCGYKCDGYVGSGFFGQRISTAVCRHCRMVQPLTVGGVIADVVPSFSTEYGRLCPQCISYELSIWDGHTCPKCGGRTAKEGDKEFWT